MCVVTAYGVQCLVTGCRGSGAGQQAVNPGRGMLHDAIVQQLINSEVVGSAWKQIKHQYINVIKLPIIYIYIYIYIYIHIH